MTFYVTMKQPDGSLLGLTRSGSFTADQKRWKEWQSYTGASRFIYSKGRPDGWEVTSAIALIPPPAGCVLHELRDLATDKPVPGERHIRYDYERAKEENAKLQAEGSPNRWVCIEPDNEYRIKAMRDALQNLLDFASEYDPSDRASYADWSGYFKAAEDVLKL